MKRGFAFYLALIIANSTLAQAPGKMSFQAVVRNNSNMLIINQQIGMRISILSGSIDGTASYIESHSPQTNSNGLVSIEIGTGNILSGTFENIDWSDGVFYIKTETDPTGGNNYTISGTQQLLSVPYAFYASKVGRGGSEGQVLTMCGGIPTWTNGGQCPGTITAINCDVISTSGNFFAGQTASGITMTIPYSGGNGGVYETSSFVSTGVTGLTATLDSGNFSNGEGFLTLHVSGTPNNSGIASFDLSIGGLSCNIQQQVNSPIIIGSLFGGGIVIHIFNSDEAGYVPGEIHGISVATQVQGTAEWGCSMTNINGTSDLLGTGQSNTNAIIEGCTSLGIAARICDDLNFNGYADWYLPSKGEGQIIYNNLGILFQTLTSIGMPPFTSTYWTSTEQNLAYAWYFSYIDAIYYNPKTTPLSVLPVRTF